MSQNNINKKFKAQSLLELLVAISVGIILIGSSVTIMGVSLRIYKSIREKYTASTLLRAESEELISLSHDNWHNLDTLSTTTEYTLISPQGIWTATSCQQLLNFDFSAIYSNYHPGWDESLNGTNAPALGFGSGYNGGVTSPSIGYHAHINPTSGIDGDAAFEYIDENCQYGYCHRWEGVWYSLNTPASHNWSAGTQITVSLYGKVDTVEKPVRFGLYYYNLAGTQDFYSGLPALYFTSPNVWQRQNYTFTLSSDIDTSKLISLYIYGQYGSEGTLWVDNVRLFDNSNINNCIKTVNNQQYLQSFAIRDVYRDSNGNIVASGGTFDPSTKKIYVEVEDWGSYTSRFNNLFYLTRSSNDQIFHQTDWSGGSGQTGPLPNPGNSFDSSSNIAFSGSSTVLEDCEDSGESHWSGSDYNIIRDNTFVYSGSYNVKLTENVNAEFDDFFLTFDNSIDMTNKYLGFWIQSDKTIPVLWVDPVDSSGNRMNAWKAITTLQANVPYYFYSDMNSNTYHSDIKSIWFFTNASDQAYYPITFKIDKVILGTSEGELRLNGTSTSGWLISSILDTGVSGGAAFHSLSWQGSVNTGQTVQFQIAFSNNQAGSWTYYGPTSVSDYYQPNPNVSVAFPTTGSASPQNYRYLRYKVFLSTTGTSPQVNDIIINWSP